MKLIVRHYNKNKQHIVKKIEHLNKMKHPLNLRRSNHLFVGYIDDVPVCFLGLNERCGNYYFRGCFVQKEFRGNGFQRQLMNFACHEVKLWGITKITSYVEMTNYHSLNNALSVGFKIDGIKNKTLFHITKKITT